MSDLLTRIRVLATSALSWLTAISAVLVVLAQQLDIVSVVGVDVPEWVPRAIASLIALIATITLQVRRVTPVDDADKGLLPPKGPAVETVDGAADRGEVGLAMIFLLVALVLFLIVGAIGAGWITSQYVTAFLGFGLASWVLASLVP